MQIAEEEEENRPSPLALISQDSSTSRLLPPNRRSTSFRAGRIPNDRTGYNTVEQ